MNEGTFSQGYAIGRDTANCNNGFGGFGNDGAWWILILLLAGWGNNGGFGGGFGGNAGFNSFELGRLATTNDVASGFSTSEIMSDLNDILLGQANIQQTLCQGFNGVNTAVLQSANATERGFCDLGYKLQNCCCETQRAIDNVNFNMSKGFCDVIRSGQDNTRQILDFLTQDKISTLTAENAALTAQLSQNAQTRTLIDTLRPVAQPAYITCSPYESVNGFNRGCGCGC